jgi:hypothetical protein
LLLPAVLLSARSALPGNLGAACPLTSPGSH